MGRSTFYSHFNNKEDLLYAGFQLLQNMLEQKYTELQFKQTFSISLELFLHAESHLKLYKAMVGKNSGQLMTKHLHTILHVKLKKHLTETLNDKKLTQKIDMAATWATSSFLSILIWWLDRNCPVKAEEIDMQFRQLTLPGLKSILDVELK